MFSGIRQLLLGSPLTTAEELEQRLTKIKALAIFSSDALSSVAYATEEILLVLVAAGSLAMGYSLPIAFSIVALLLIVAFSYFQTIHGYPSGGGAYIVAHENLGEWPGLVAAASLLIDYVLTVAVSVTAGIAAVTSAFPGLIPFKVELCLIAIVLITWMNLRGVKESGTLFSIPSYSFVIITLSLIGVGIFRLATGSLAANSAVTAINTAAQVDQGLQTISLFIILRAFSSGCTALTGVEAISNGIQAFKKPEAENAGKTLIAMAFLLATMFLGITYLARFLGITPYENETVISQIGRSVFGVGIPYLALQIATALILVLAANTSFAGFPRLSAILAQDRYLPRQMSNLGDRLVFANGIGVLAFLAAFLVIIFNGQTHRLIPLYAVGVFLSFTLSQAGMVRYWKRKGIRNWYFKAIINGVGAVATGIVLLVVASTKFVHGAWIVIILIPTIVQFLYAIKKHYITVA
ncbi:MAG: amino acid permease, partial [Anaerolineales bacterium]|nr:amino acid permease [Anaerolineales bacterium]